MENNFKACMMIYLSSLLFQAGGCFLVRTEIAVPLGARSNTTFGKGASFEDLRSVTVPEKF